MCTICRHPARTVIERDLLAGPSVGAVAAHHNIPFHEARQHKVRLQARVEQARRQLEQLQLAESLDRLRLLLDKTMLVLGKAEEAGDLKLMLQAIREAERLTKMLHALPVDLEAASLFLAATDKDWPRAASPLPTQPWVRDSVRQAIQHSLKNPCAGSHFAEELSPAPASLPEKPVPALRQGKVSRRPQNAVIPWSSDMGTATATGVATTPPDSPTEARKSRAAPASG